VAGTAGGLLRGGASAGDRATLREGQLAAARWVEGFCSPGYGPHGAAKLVGGAWVRSPALALREAGTGPLLAPYADLAKRMHQACGDQATAALLLAARLVRAGLEADAPQVPAWLHGYRLAARQAKAWLAANSEAAKPEDALAAVAEPGWAAVVVDGLRRLGAGAGREIDLGAVDVRAEPGAGPGGEASWLDGVVVEPQDAPAAGPCRVLLLSAGWSPKPRAEGVQARFDPGLAEDALRRRAADHLAALGVGFVACAGTLDDGLRGRLLDRGVAAWTHAPLSALERLAKATGARPAARLDDAAAGDLGRGRLARRPRRGWLLRGDGPSATLVLPGASQPAREAAVEAGERLLRAAGAVLPAPSALPGGGRWQRGLAASLRSAADAAPGHAPFAVREAAQAVDALADDLLRNAGLDVLAGGLPPGADGVLDPAPCVRLAVASAFEAASAALRLDGAYAKRPSSAVDLRGGTGPSGSRRGMPGDVPPLM
jgi:hypothetical protein